MEPVVFKKRAPKAGHARKRTEQSDDEEDEGNKEVLMDIKLQQTVRQRRAGASAELLSKAAVGSSTSSAAAEPGESRTIESVMGTQYTAQLDYGLQVNIPHKKLMDQYIDEKLGEKPTERIPAKTETAEDLLYKIPDNIKVVSKLTSSVSADPTDNGIVPAWSTQLAEVALPISFKLRNIEATERAAVQDANKAATGPSSIAAHYRFNAYERAPKLHPSLESFAGPSDPSAPGGPPAGQQQQAGQKRPLKSSDDRALDQYRKRQMNHRR